MEAKVKCSLHETTLFRETFFATGWCHFQTFSLCYISHAPQYPWTAARKKRPGTMGASKLNCSPCMGLYSFHLFNTADSHVKWITCKKFHSKMSSYTLNDRVHPQYVPNQWCILESKLPTRCQIMHFVLSVHFLCSSFMLYRDKLHLFINEN